MIRVFDFYARGDPAPKWLKVALPVSVALAGVFALWLSWHRPSLVRFFLELGSSKFGEFFLGHLGVALVIAGVVGIGYELLSHERRLRLHVERLIAINAEIADRQLDAVLETLLPTRKADDGVHRDLRDYTATLVRSLKQPDRTDVRPHIVSLKFTALLLRYAKNAASALSSEISEDGEHRLTLPASSAALADEILAEQLHQMRRGDTYDVVSDFSTWRYEQLPKFWAELQRAADRSGIRIRRLFCRFVYDQQLTNKDVFDVLHAHLELAVARHRTHRGSYSVGLAFVVAPEHVGVFKYKKGKHIVSFKPQDQGTLERITISRRDDCPEFTKKWDNAITSDNTPDMATLVKTIVARDGQWWSGFRQADGFDVAKAASELITRGMRPPKRAPLDSITTADSVDSLRNR